MLPFHIKNLMKIKYIIKNFLIVFFFFLPIIVMSNFSHLKYKTLEPLYKAKLEDFSKIKNKVQIIFIGTSTIWRNINTMEFDKEIKKYNLQYTSYNFGIPNMKYGEVLFLLKEIYKLKPKKLKSIIIEARINQNSSNRELHNSRKFIFWHDFDNTIKAIIIDYEFNQSIKANIGNIYYHLRALYINFINKGNGFYTVNYYYKSPNKQVEMYHNYKKKIKRGNLSLDKEYGLVSKRHKRFLKMSTKFSKNLNKLMRLPTRKINIYKTRQYFYDHIIQWTEKMKIKLLFLSTLINNQDLAVITNKKQYSVLQLNDLQKHSTLYQADGWFDFAHFNKKGAKEASKHLAKLFVESISNKNKTNKLDVTEWE